MNKLWLVLVAITFVSCASIPTEMPASWSLSEINEWIYYNIKYDNTARTSDTVQSAEVTLAKRTGSCYDMSVLFISMSKGAVELFGVTYNGNYHMMVVSKTLGYYDPTNNKVYGWELPKGWIPYEGEY